MFYEGLVLRVDSRKTRKNLCDSETTWFSCFSRFWRCCGVFQGLVWLTKVVPSILRVHWVYIGALSGDSDASGSFWGSLKGLEIAISLCDSETTWFSCFSRCWRCCVVFQGWVWLTKVVPSILRAHWVHIRALSVDIDASGSFLGVSEGASNCDFPMWQWKTRDFLVFHDFDDVVVFSRAGYGWQKLFRAYCGYNGWTLEHFQSIVMPLGRFGGLWRG